MVAALAKKNVGAAWLIPDRDRAVRITIIPKHGSDHLIVADQPAQATTPQENAPPEPAGLFHRT